MALILGLVVAAALVAAAVPAYRWAAARSETQVVTVTATKPAHREGGDR